MTERVLRDPAPHTIARTIDREAAHWADARLWDTRQFSAEGERFRTGRFLVGALEFVARVRSNFSMQRQA